MRAVTTTTASTSRAVDGGRERRVSGRGFGAGEDAAAAAEARARRARARDGKTKRADVVERWGGRWGVGRDGREMRETRVWASADAGAGAGAGAPGRGAPEENFFAKHLRKMISPLDGLWGRLIPMSLMFYFMAFANSIMDAVKDTLVVTAFGGAEQIPYLTVYAVLPTSLLFVSLFAKLSSKFGREKLFYFAVTFFMAFFALFTGVLYPLRDVLHPYELAAHLSTILPNGLAGGIAVFTNWTYSLFYVAGELWGDVVLSLLFWGLANEITRVSEAGIIIPCSASAPTSRRRVRVCS